MRQGCDPVTVCAHGCDRALELPCDLLVTLTRHQPQTDFRGGGGRNACLDDHGNLLKRRPGTLPAGGVAASDAI